MKCLLIIKSQICSDCSNYYELDDCSYMDCLRCPNADYKLISEDGSVLRDYNKEVKNKDYEENEFMIDLCDYDYDLSIEDYLADEQAKYIITDLNGNVSSFNGMEIHDINKKIKDDMICAKNNILKIWGEKYFDSQKNNEPKKYSFLDYYYRETEDPRTAYIYRKDNKRIDSIDLSSIFLMYKREKSKEILVPELDVSFIKSKDNKTYLVSLKTIGENVKNEQHEKTLRYKI